jgi:hypothetical protein
MLMFYTNPGAANFANADGVYDGSAAGNTYIATTDGIAAKEMGDERYYCAYAKLSDGTYAYSKLMQYSPKTYAMSRLQNSNDVNMKALCVAMLNYGAAAQTFFNYRTDALMNAGLTAEQKALVKGYDKSYFTGSVKADASKLGGFASTNSGFSGASVSVSFEGAFSINYYIKPDTQVKGDLKLYVWTPEAYASATRLTAGNASSVVVMKAQPDGSYWGQVSGIAAKNLDDTYYVSAVYADANGGIHCCGVVAYALSTYCMNNANGGMGGLAQNTAMYGYYAAQYFNK